jgi:hypothetical protein
MDDERIKKALRHLCKAAKSLDDLSDTSDQMANCILTLDITIDFLRDELGND